MILSSLKPTEMKLESLIDGESQSTFTFLLSIFIASGMHFLAHIRILPLCHHDSHLFKKFILLEDANADTLELLRLVLQQCPELLGLIKDAFKPYKCINFYDDYKYCGEMEKIHVLKILYRDNHYGTSKQRKEGTLCVV